MNEVFFTCNKCKIYIDAGYRWAYWSLEDITIVQPGKAFSVEAVINETKYWSPPVGGWPSLKHLEDVREFLLCHAAHQLTYGDIETFLPDADSESVLEWMEIGCNAVPSIRSLAASSDFQSWEDVIVYFKEHSAPWWFEDPRLHALARKRFVETSLPSKREGL